MTEDPMYSFTFSKPVEFKRVYNFFSPFAPSNKLWLPQESSESYIASTKSKTKNTLVKILKISPKFIWQKHRYVITLIGNATDSFVIQKNDIGEFLELFDLK